MVVTKEREGKGWDGIGTDGEGNEAKKKVNVRLI